MQQRFDDFSTIFRDPDQTSEDHSLMARTLLDLCLDFKRYRINNEIERHPWFTNSQLSVLCYFTDNAYIACIKDEKSAIDAVNSAGLGHIMNACEEDVQREISIRILTTYAHACSEESQRLAEIEEETDGPNP